MRNALVLLSLAGASCAAHRALVPAPAAEAVPGRGEGAVSRAEEVAVEVRANAWVGFPSELDAVEPLRVTVDNESAHPLRIRYEDVQLRSDDGQTFAALPPFDIRGSENVVVDLTPPPASFYVAPYASRFYPGITPWFGPFDLDNGWWDTWYPAMTRIQLPTGDMIQKALPEGVLDHGGKLTGFVYFQAIPRETKHVTFEMQLVDARTGESFGTARVPFDVVRQSQVEGEAVSDAE